MIRTFQTFIFLFLISSPTLAESQGKISIDEVISAGRPADIEIRPQVAGPNSCSTILGSMPDGTPQLVAVAYNNGAYGHLRMLSVNPQSLSVTVIADVGRPQYLLAGSSCSMRLVDLSGSSGNKALSRVLQIDFPGLSGKGSATWFFEWTGSMFFNLGPVETSNDFPADTLLLMGGLKDLDHNGIVQIVSLGDGEVQPEDETGVWNMPTHWVWHFNGTSFVFDRALTEIASFTRPEGKPIPVVKNVTPDICYLPACREFELIIPKPFYRLKVINGNADGSQRISSGHVLLNNVEVVSPSDLNQKIEFITMTITLQQRNTLYVSLDGQPGGTIVLTIEPL